MTHERVFTGPFDGRRITGPAADHVSKVLRLRKGGVFSGYDGRREYELRVLETGRGEVAVECVSSRDIPPTPAENIILAASMLKAKRWEQLLEKAVELGTGAVWPVEAARCVVKIEEGALAEKKERWERIMGSAVAQSAGRMPDLENPAAVEEIAARAGGAEGRFILCTNETSVPLAEALSIIQPGRAVLMIGPEGDWTEEEIGAALDAGFTAVNLGERILRSETAAAAALSVASAFAGLAGGPGKCPFYDTGGS